MGFGGGPTLLDVSLKINLSELWYMMIPYPI